MKQRNVRNSQDYIVRVITPRTLGTKRGSCSRGGTIITEEPFRFPHTPYYMAEEIMRERYPGNEYLIVLQGGHTLCNCGTMPEPECAFHK